MNEIKEYTTKLFEDIKHIDEIGNEYWLARELMKVLEYKNETVLEHVNLNQLHIQAAELISMLNLRYKYIE